MIHMRLLTATQAGAKQFARRRRSGAGWGRSRGARRIGAGRGRSGASAVGKGVPGGGRAGRGPGLEQGAGRGRSWEHGGGGAVRAGGGAGRAVAAELHGSGEEQRRVPAGTEKGATARARREPLSGVEALGGLGGVFWCFDSTAAAH
ncbi:hypothetical protein BRADI_3g03562v3 [Brachypodium distachyon]|uniref:Uncharacterized protein n=1 Tax=Brachypodium distachyon TaxID=15368 RepID=A0A2K2CUZ1_BRADI|nr:hypothetical protein BRADI_3g03562v3 [Brachypodium distachyon]